MEIKTIGKKDNRKTNAIAHSRGQNKISEAVIKKVEKVPELMQLGKGKKNGHSPDPVSNMEFMVGKKLTDAEIYCMNG